MDIIVYFLAKQSSKVDSVTTITVPLQSILILAGIVSLIFLIVFICCTGMIIKNRNNRKLNRLVILSLFVCFFFNFFLFVFD